MNLKRKSLFSALVAPVAGVPLRAAGLVLALSTLAGQAPAAELPVLSVQTAHRAHTATYDGQVEALRQSAIAAQVPPAETIAALLATVGGPTTADNLDFDAAERELAIANGHYLRDRFTARKLVRVLGLTA